MTFKGQNPHVRNGEPGGRLAERTLALVNIPSVSRGEAEAMAYVRSELRLEPVWSSEDVLFAMSKRTAGRPLVLLAGHVDTVPAQGNLPGRIEDDGLVFREVVSAVAIEGGIADNVVPDRCLVRLNYRYAPGRSREQAEARVREVACHAELEILGNSPPAHVVLDRPLVTRLRE